MENQLGTSASVIRSNSPATEREDELPLLLGSNDLSLFRRRCREVKEDPAKEKDQLRCDRRIRLAALQNEEGGDRQSFVGVTDELEVLLMPEVEVGKEGAEGEHRRREE